MSSSTFAGVKSIEDFDLKDKKLFLRLDLNVPLKNGEVTDDTRIRAAMPTIQYALDKGAKVILASHLGRPKTEEDLSRLSLEPVAKKLNELMGIEVILIEETQSDAPKALLGSLKATQVLLLENLRFDEDETKNGKSLPQAIAAYADIYINDAFGASHRAHASIVGVPKEVAKKGVGFLMKREIEMLDTIMQSPESPYVAILGGAKVSDKIPVIEKLIDKVDQFIVGGAMAYTFLEAQGIPVGKSLVEKSQVNFARGLIERVKARGKEILLPIDHVIAPKFDAVTEAVTTKGAAIENGWMGLDIGPKTIETYKQALMKAKTVFWNGPMGVFETPEFSKGTFSVAEALANNGATNIVGGGDSASAARASGYADQMTHISTGGGASLEYLQGLRMPGIEVLKPPKQSEGNLEEA